MFKKIFIVFGVLLSLLLIVPNFINWNPYKKPILKQIHLRTGLHMDVSGDISFSFFPFVKLKVAGMTVKNTPGGKAKNMATIKSLDLRVELLPLLWGQVNISKISLVEPKIYFEMRKDGKGNWQSIGQEKPEIKTSSNQLKLSVRHISIQGGSLSYDDVTIIDGVNLSGSMNLKTLRGPIKVETHGTPAATNHNQSTKSSAEKWSKDPIDLSFLKNVDFDLNLDMSELKPYDLSHVLIISHINNGHLNISTEGKGYKGKGNFKITASLQPDSMLFINYNVKNIKVTSLPYLQKTSLKKATLTMSGDLQGKASSVYNLVHSLSGKGKFLLSHGVVEAFDVKQLIADLKNTKDLSGLSKLSQLKEDLDRKALVNFSDFYTDFSVQKGVVHTQNLKLVHDDIIIKGKGYVNLPMWYLDLKTFIQIKIKKLKLPPLGLNIQGCMDFLDSLNLTVDQDQFDKIMQIIEARKSN